MMVWIHGGGFTLGSKDIYRMQAIIDQDVVLVAMNYRSCLSSLAFSFLILCSKLPSLQAPCSRLPFIRQPSGKHQYCKINLSLNHNI